PEFDALTRRIAGDRGSRLVIGDFNRTEASPRFGEFVRSTGLRDSRYGFGRQASWPCKSPISIAIGRALPPGDVAVVDRRLGPDIGSDHSPLILESAPAASSRNAAAQSSQSRP